MNRTKNVKFCSLLLSLIVLLGAPPALAQELPVTTNSEEARALYERSVDQYSHARSMEASTTLEQSIEADSTFALGYALLAYLNHYDAASGVDLAEKALHYVEEASSAEQTFVAAVHAYVAGDFDEAVDLALELHEKYPGSFIPTLMAAETLYFQFQDFARSEKILRTGIERHPNLNFLHNALGYTLRAQGKMEEAKVVFEKNIEHHPEQPNPYDSAANLYRAMDDLEKAAQLYEKAIEIEPDFEYGEALGSARNRLGYTYLALGRMDEAETVFKEDIRQHPDHANPYDSLGELYLRTGRYDQAAEQFKLALEIDPELTYAQNHLVEVHIKQAYAGLTQAMEEGDAAQIANSYYMEDAMLFPPNAEPARGREAIEEVFTDLIEAELVVDPEPVEIEVYGDAAYEYGEATVRKDDQRIARQPYMVIWKQVNGDWKMHRDFVKSSTE